MNTKDYYFVTNKNYNSGFHFFDGIYIHGNYHERNYDDGFYVASINKLGNLFSTFINCVYIWKIEIPYSHEKFKSSKILEDFLKLNMLNLIEVQKVDKFMLNLFVDNSFENDLIINNIEFCNNLKCITRSNIKFYDNTQYGIINGSIIWTIANNNFELFKIIITKFKLNNFYCKIYTECSIRYKNDNVLKWFYNNEYISESNIPYFIDCAAQYNNLPALIFLKKYNDFYRIGNSIYIAISEQNVDMVKWLHKNMKKKFNFEKFKFESDFENYFLEASFTSICMSGNVELFNWYHLENNYPIILSKDILDTVAKNGHCFLIDYLYDKSKSNFILFSTDVIDIASSNLHLNILEKLSSKFQNSSLRQFRYSTKAIDNASLKLNKTDNFTDVFDVIKWFYNNNLELKYTDETIKSCYQNDRSDIIYWLFEKNKMLCFSFASIDEIFKNNQNEEWTNIIEKIKAYCT